MLGSINSKKLKYFYLIFLKFYINILNLNKINTKGKK
jgi:hypothetical protein